jgi:hypothetical protein
VSLTRGVELCESGATGIGVDPDGPIRPRCIDYNRVSEVSWTGSAPVPVEQCPFCFVVKYSDGRFSTAGLFISPVSGVKLEHCKCCASLLPRLRYIKRLVKHRDHCYSDKRVSEPRQARYRALIADVEAFLNKRPSSRV